MQTPGLFKKSPAFTFQPVLAGHTLIMIMFGLFALRASSWLPYTCQSRFYYQVTVHSCTAGASATVSKCLSTPVLHLSAAVPVPSGHTLNWLYLVPLLFRHPNLHLIVIQALTNEWLSIPVLLALLQLLASVCPLLSLLNKCLSTTVLHLSAAAPSLLLNKCLSIPVPRFILIIEWWIGQIRNALVDEAI